MAWSEMKPRSVWRRDDGRRSLRRRYNIDMDTGKIVLILGIVLVAVGLWMSYGPTIPYIGRLPGDIYIKRDNFTFYFPLTTSILLSIILSILFRIFSK